MHDSTYNKYHFCIFGETNDIMKKYARKSSFDGKGMNSGYCFENGDYYCQNDKQAKKYVESLGLGWEEEVSKFNTKEEWFYHTDWEEIDNEEYFDLSLIHI